MSSSAQAAPSQVRQAYQARSSDLRAQIQHRLFQRTESAALLGWPGIWEHLRSGSILDLETVPRGGRGEGRDATCLRDHHRTPHLHT